MPKLNNQLELNRCSHCGVAKPNLPMSWAAQTRGHSGDNQRFWKIYKCLTCGGLITASATSDLGQVVQYFPANVKVHEAISNPAGDFLQQAIDSIHTPAGSVMLSASSVDAMLKLKGYTDGTLYKRINAAIKDNIITREMGDWAHEIRLDANDQRHADSNAELPSKTDARKCIDFALALAQFLFVLPQQVQRGLADAGKTTN